MKVTTSIVFATSLISRLAVLTPIQVPTYPEQQVPANFRLVVNATLNDFTPSIKNYYVSGYHSGAGTSIAVLNPKSGLVSYENGTSRTQKDIRRLILYIVAGKVSTVSNEAYDASCYLSVTSIN